MRTRAQLMTAIVCLAIYLAFLVLLASGEVLDWTFIERLALFSTALFVAVAWWAFAVRRVSAFTVFLWIFALFHFGLFVVDSLGVQAALLGSAGFDWFRSDLVARAALSSVIGMCALTIGGLVREASGRDDSLSPRTPACEHDRYRSGVGVVALSSLAIGVALWFYSVLGGGVSVSETSYTAFRAATSTSELATAYSLIALGMGFLAASNSVVRLAGLALFGLFAVPALLLGARTPVYFPLLAYLVAATRLRSIRHGGALVLGSLAAFSLVGVVRQVRVSGLGGTDFGSIALSPWGTVSEMGSTLRPVVEAHRWHDVLGEPLVGLGTYYAPLERLVLGRALGLSVPDAASDPRVFSSVVAARVGQIGGSPVAEAYRAGGLLTVVLVLLLLGWILRWMDHRPTTPLATAFVGGVSVLLFAWVRNDFTPVTLGVLVTLGALGVAKLMSDLTTSRSVVRAQAG